MSKIDYSVPRIIIDGPPASGKGTHSEILVKKYGVVHLSTGSILRAEVEKQTDLGKEVAHMMESGELVPDSIVNKIVHARLCEEDCKTRGWLLDGYPRTVEQAQFLKSCGDQPNLYLLLSVPDEICVARSSGRLIDPVTGNSYHITNSPPPLEIAKRVIQRHDDREEVIRARLAQYHKQSDPIQSFFHDVLLSVDASGNIQTVNADVLKAVNLHFKPLPEAEVTTE